MLSPARTIDHTLLKATATADQIQLLCEEAVEYGFAAVCIPPVHVPLAARLVYGSETAVATVVGFPFGYMTTAVKVLEAVDAVAHGATEIDMVISLAAALDKRFAEVEDEIRRVVAAADKALVKVILECCYLDDVTKAELVACCWRAGAGMVKTSTGCGPGGATVADVALLARAGGGRIGVKAAGGIRDWQSCQALLAAGANRIGTSSGVAIMRQWQTLMETGAG